MQRTRLYSITMIACLAGYAWLVFIALNPAYGSGYETVCLIKNFTGVPCPSCGASRSIMSIMNGQFLHAAALNPIGYLLVAIMVVSPFWILSDLASSKDSFLRFYKKVEMMVRKKWIAIPMITILAANWIWNILKGL